MPNKFKTKKGKDTDIFHSYPYLKSKHKMRSDIAFNKEFLAGLTDEDKLLLRGYAQRLDEERKTFKHKNPKYAPKGVKSVYGISDFRKHYYGTTKKK